jgi:hypothetical protein
MARSTLAAVVALVATVAAAGCTRQAGARTDADAGISFAVDPPTVYVAKVKNILVGLPPTDDEIAKVTADPSSLAGLIDGWMQLPEYQDKMRVFFELAFQQTQITAADFTEMIPPQGVAVGQQTNLLIQNLKESFARTALAIVGSGRPITDAFTTKQLMMTPALMELYAFLDARHVDDNAKITDAFAKANPTLTITIEASAGPIAIADSINPASPNYMHWYNPNVGKLTQYANQSCNTDPIVLKVDAYALHLLLYGGIGNHTAPANPAAGNCPITSTTGFQMQPTDFTTWNLVTLRAPKAGEATTAFYDLPTLRTANELVVATPRNGFFTTPAFGANWPTNTSNQMRVTINQTLIVATGAAVDGTDPTVPDKTPGLDAAHAAPGSACYGCHQTLDPTRAILESTYSYYYYPQTDPTLMAQKGLFAFQGVVKPVATIDDFAATLASHPLVASAWAQKLCYWANSSACVADDPEFQRVVQVFQSSGLSWNALVRELLSSPITTNTVETRTTNVNGEVIAVTRRDHLCALLDNRLGLSDICGLDTTVKRAASAVPQIVSGLPSDGYGRGATVPVLPNQPTLFYRAGLENICASVAAMVIDAKANASQPNAKSWSSAQPDAAIADFVSTLMALGSADPRAAQATQILTQHFNDAKAQGVAASDALKSTFVAACLAPSTIGIGM